MNTNNNTGPVRRRHARTLWSLAVLSLLREGDMHPYEMQRQMHLRHTDELLALKRGSLYHAINQLQRDGLIEPVQTSREGRWPERTVYRVTPDGEEELVTWLRDLLSVSVREPSQFMAAVAHIADLSPQDALQQLQMRAVNLEATSAAMLAVERGVAELVGRPAVLEVEYARALLNAELAWLRAVIDDLRAGRLTWSVEKLKTDIHIINSNIDVIAKEEDTA
jgi:DNA-binding PadR family transcriptional regulator